MLFETDDDELTLRLVLTWEPEDLDLTRDGLGEQILDAAAEAMRGSALREEDPDGFPWPALAPATARAKGDARVGFRTGQMIGDLSRGETAVEPRSATWRYPRGGTWPRAHGFHNGGHGRPPRRLVGWTEAAKGTASSLLAGAAGAPPGDDQADRS